MEIDPKTCRKKSHVTITLIDNIYRTQIGHASTDANDQFIH